MPTRRIDDSDVRTFRPRETCAHPEHNPPSHMVFPPGLYEHECPSCGRTVTFRVNSIVYGSCTTESRFSKRDEDAWSRMLDQ